MDREKQFIGCCHRLKRSGEYPAEAETLCSLLDWFIEVLGEENSRASILPPEAARILKSDDADVRTVINELNAVLKALKSGESPSTFEPEKQGELFQALENDAKNIFQKLYSFADGTVPPESGYTDFFHVIDLAYIELCRYIRKDFRTASNIALMEIESLKIIDCFPDLLGSEKMSTRVETAGLERAGRRFKEDLVNIKFEDYGNYKECIYGFHDASGRKRRGVIDCVTDYKSAAGNFKHPVIKDLNTLFSMRGKLLAASANRSLIRSIRKVMDAELLNLGQLVQRINTTREYHLVTDGTVTLDYMNFSRTVHNYKQDTSCLDLRFLWKTAGEEVKI
jgi:hypothetical protein